MTWPLLLRLPATNQVANFIFKQLATPSCATASEEFNVFYTSGHSLFTSFQSSQTSWGVVWPAVTGRTGPSELRHLGALHGFPTPSLKRLMAGNDPSELEPLHQGRRP